MLYLKEVSLDLVTIAGLMLALSIIIDDALVDVRNIGQRLRQARDEGSEKSAATIVLEAAFEMRSPLIYATVIMALAVVPFVALDGVAGAIFQPLVAAYLVAVLASMCVALTVTPALSLLLLRNGSAPALESHTGRMLCRLHRAFFGWAASRPVPVLVGIGAIAVAGIASMSLLRQSPCSRISRRRIRWFAWTGCQRVPCGHEPHRHHGQSRPARDSRRPECELPIGARIASDKRANVNAGELWVSIDPSADRDATVASVRQVLADYSGVSHEVMTYLQAKLREELSGTGNPCSFAYTATT